jgi:hypothetical protein
LICSFAGFFIRVVLLSGSTFKKQLIPQTHTLLILSTFGVIFSAGMQLVLAWYLWTRLPPPGPSSNGNSAPLHYYPGTDEGRGFYNAPPGFARVPLPAYPYPNYKFANDVCRTVPIVQLVCVCLFLFNVLNNLPSVIKNAFIILYSERFVSVDEDGVTKLHYWRESGVSRQPQNGFLDWFSNTYLDGAVDASDIPAESRTKAMMQLKVFLCEMYFKGSFIPKPAGAEKTAAESTEALLDADGKSVSEASKDEGAAQTEAFSRAIRRRWMLPKFVRLPHSKWPDEAYKIWLALPLYKRVSWRNPRPVLVPRSMFEVNEIRAFLAEALRLIDVEHNAKRMGKEPVVEYPDYLKENKLKLNKIRNPNEKLQNDDKDSAFDVSFCDQVRLQEQLRARIIRYMRDDSVLPPTAGAAQPGQAGLSQA